MQSVIETEGYLNDAAEAGLSDDERRLIVDTIAADPDIGVVMPGTGGARKVRFAGRGKGKSGGYRVITYFAATDVPVFLLALVSKGDRADLSKAEKNELREILSGLADDYRAAARARAASPTTEGER